MDKTKIAILIVALGLVVAFAIVFSGNISQLAPWLTPSGSVANKAVDYINKNLLQPGQTAVLESYSLESGLIKMVISIDGQTYDSYVTKDGKLLFPISPVVIGDLSDTSEDQVTEGVITADFVITEQDHIRGNPSATVTLVEFSDFECPFCANFIPTIERILGEYEGRVRLVYKHFPLTNIHPNAFKAAEASECAGEQGKFWEYHDILFQNQSGGLSVEKFKGWAADLGLSTSQFNNCLDSAKYANKVQEDISEGLSKGVSGTPGTFVNGELVSGAVPFETLKQKIDKLLP